MTFKEYCRYKYGLADDSISVDEYEMLVKVMDKADDGDKYRQLTWKIWHEWYSDFGEQRRYQAALDKLYLKYCQKENL